MPLTSLALSGAGPEGTVAPRQWLTLTGATLLHATLAAGLVLVPLLHEPEAPEPAGVRALLVALPDLAAPPPPPPAPAPRAAAPVARPSTRTGELLAPVGDPPRIADEGPEAADLDGGVPAGIAGGVEGGVEGGVVGGLGEASAPAARVVRIGGLIREPRVLRDVAPVYPPMALAAHAGGLVILELQVGRDGSVREVNVLRAEPLFLDAAVEAARQRKYQPLLLDGVPTDFVVTVTIRFALRPPR